MDLQIVIPEAEHNLWRHGATVVQQQLSVFKNPAVTELNKDFFCFWVLETFYKRSTIKCQKLRAKFGR